VTAEWAFWGLGTPEEFPADLPGKIALITRGVITFWEKTKNAKDRGAIAVAIFNRDASPLTWTLIPEEDPETLTIDWPVTVALTQHDGEELLSRGSGTITVSTAPDDYGTLDGTSMATPHVAGAAALLWAIAPNATAAEIVAALTGTALDLGTAGPDPVFGAGLINVFDAAKRLNPTAFEPIDPMNPPPGSRPSTGRRFVKRRG
jgi:serine protease